MSLLTRLSRLEQTAERKTPPTPGEVIFCKGSSPDQDEQRQIDNIRANGQHAVIFTIRPGEL